MADANKTLITLENMQTYTEQVKSLISSEGGGFSISRDIYSFTASTTGAYQTTIPSYDASTCFVDAYLNGLSLIPNTEYTVSSSGVFQTVNTVNTGGVIMIVVWRTAGGGGSTPTLKVATPVIEVR